MIEILDINFLSIILHKIRKKFLIKSHDIIYFDYHY